MKTLTENIIERQANEMEVINRKYKMQYKQEKYVFIAIALLTAVFLAI